VLSDSFFIVSGKQLKTFIPAKYTPFWYLVNLVCGKKRLALFLVFFVWISEFGVNNYIFLITNNASDNMYWDCNGRIPSSLNNLWHEILLLAFVISLMALFW